MNKAKVAKDGGERGEEQATRKQAVHGAKRHGTLL
jgi:hypothetical protein